VSALSLACACSLAAAERAAAVAQYTRVRKDDQIVDGVLVYEKDRQRSLEFTQARSRALYTHLVVPSHSSWPDVAPAVAWQLMSRRCMIR
jgi:hypothetical protein